MKLIYLCFFSIFLLSCSDDCNCPHWQTCSGGHCVLKDGACDNSSDCSGEKTSCNADHWCDYPPQNLCETLPCTTLFGSYSFCELHNNLPICSCDIGYYLTFEGCLPEACRNNKCAEILTHSTCILDEDDIALCVCPEGYDIDIENGNCIDPCDALNCAQLGEGAYCDRLEQICGCQEGYKLKDQKCVLDDICFDIDCDHYLANSRCFIKENQPTCRCKTGYLLTDALCIPNQTPPNLCDTISCDHYIPGSICQLVEINNTQQPGCICPIGSQLINGSCIFENLCDSINCDDQIIGSSCTINNRQPTCSCLSGYQNIYGICVKN